MNDTMEKRSRPGDPDIAELGGAPPRLGLWWLSPAGALLLVVPASLLGAWLISDARYRVEWRTPKMLTGSFTALLLMGLCVLLVGTLWPQVRRRRVWRGPWPRLASEHRDVLALAGTWTFRLTVFGYLAMGVVGAVRGITPGQLIEAFITLNTFDNSLKTGFAPVAGVTTFTQLGIAHVVIAGLQLGRNSPPGTTRRLVVVLGLAGARGFLLNERLALLELLVPLVAVLALRTYVSVRARRRPLIRFAPVILVPLVIGFFGLFEYARSWQFFGSRGGTSFLDFALIRFIGYYATAYNNTQIAYEHAWFPNRLPYSSLEALWTAPGIEQLNLYSVLTGGDVPASYAMALAHYGNDEFNNPGGLGSPFLDFGSVGGLVFLFLLGSLVGLCWANLTTGGFTGMLLYPVVLTGMFEMPRYLYLTQGRVLPALVVLSLVAWRLNRGRPFRLPAVHARRGGGGP